MKKAIALLILTGLIVFSVSGTIRAEEPSSVNKALGDIKQALGLSIYLQGGYTYNTRDPESGQNDLRVFDHDANTINLDLAQIVFNRDAPVGGVGFRLKLSAGETAKWIHSRGLGDTDDPFDLTEAYIDYIAPLGNGLKFRFGKFVTMHGAEVIEALDNMNYSRSFLFNYAIPFTHTGLMIGYPFSDTLSVNAYLVNGWDNTSDNNDGKTGALSMTWSPMEQLSMILNAMYGPEKDDNNSDGRFLVDWTATIKAVKDVTFVINADYASEEHSAPDRSAAVWWGIAGYAKYDFNDMFSAAVRAEYFKDEDGARTSAAQALKEITLTSEVRLVQGLVIRPEYRHDWSDKNVFDSGNGKTQDTVALGVMYRW